MKSLRTDDGRDMITIAGRRTGHDHYSSLELKKFKKTETKTSGTESTL